LVSRGEDKECDALCPRIQSRVITTSYQPEIVEPVVLAAHVSGEDRRACLFLLQEESRREMKVFSVGDYARWSAVRSRPSAGCFNKSLVGWFTDYAARC